MKIVNRHCTKTVQDIEMVITEYFSVWWKLSIEGGLKKFGEEEKKSKILLFTGEEQKKFKDT